MNKGEFQAKLIYTALKEERMKTKTIPMKECPACKGKCTTTVIVNGKKEVTDCGACDGLGEVPDYSAKKEKE